MPSSSGPNTVSDSVIFNYDTGDVANSYKGEPTTNQVTNASTFNGGWASYSNGNDGTFITEFGTTGYQIINRGSWNGIYQNFNLGSSGTYTFSAWFRYLGGSANNNGATVYISNYGGGDTAAGLDKSLVGVWQRVSHTVNVSSPGNVYFYIISYGGTYGADNSSWQVTMPQAEQKSYATRFTNGTRSSTQGLLDISGNNNTINLVNMTYNAAALPIFDGTDDYTDVGSWFNYQTFTIDLWVRPGATQTTYADIFDNNHTGTQNFVCQQNVNNVNQYEFAVINNSSASGTGLFNLTANTWVNLTFTFDGTRARFFRNGVLELNGSSITGPINYSSPNLRLGGWYNGGRNWNGQIAKFSTYNRVLSGTEIANNYNQNKTRFNLQ